MAPTRSALTVSKITPLSHPAGYVAVFFAETPPAPARLGPVEIKITRPDGQALRIQASIEAARSPGGQETMSLRVGGLGAREITVGSQVEF